jgi:hypothetical protein
MRSMVEGAHREREPDTVGPLRQPFGLPPPRSGEDLNALALAK